MCGEKLALHHRQRRICIHLVQLLTWRVFNKQPPLNLGLHNRVHVVDQVRHAHVRPVDRLHVLHHLHETLIQLDLRLPSQGVPYASATTPSPTSTGNIRFSFTRVILGQRHVDDLALASGELHHLLRQLLHRELDGVAEVEGADHVVLLHHQDESLRVRQDEHINVDQIVDVLEGASLTAITVDGNVLAAQRLANEVGDDAAVVRVHERAVGVEDANHANVEVVGAVVVEEDGLSGSLALIVAGAGSDGVHVSVVLLCASDGGITPTGLGMDERVSVDLARAGVQETASRVAGQMKKVEDSENRALEGLDGVGLQSQGGKTATW